MRAEPSRKPRPFCGGVVACIGLGASPGVASEWELTGTRIDRDRSGSIGCEGTGRSPLSDAAPCGSLIRPALYGVHRRKRRGSLDEAGPGLPGRVSAVVSGVAPSTVPGRSRGSRPRCEETSLRGGGPGALGSRRVALVVSQLSSTPSLAPERPCRFCVADVSPPPVPRHPCLRGGKRSTAPHDRFNVERSAGRLPERLVKLPAAQSPQCVRLRNPQRRPSLVDAESSVLSICPKRADRSRVVDAARGTERSAASESDARNRDVRASARDDALWQLPHAPGGRLRIPFRDRRRSRQHP